MPVIGHAFVGLATAVAATPRRSKPGALLLWPAIIVGIAYLPDIVKQILITVGARDYQFMAHSMPLGVAVAFPLAAGLCGLTGQRFGVALAVCLFLILGHDALDYLNASDRQFLWPIFETRMHVARHVLPESLWREAVLFGGLFAAFLVVWLIARTALRWRRTSGASDQVRRRAPLVAGYVLAGCVVVTAAATHRLRELRLEQLLAADRMIVGRDYESALALIEQAARWPYGGPHSRLDYARARAYAGLGDRELAAQHYLRSMRFDPTYFWAVADLADLYASGDEPLEDRRRRVEPLRRLLETRFAHHSATPYTLARIDRKLQKAGTRPAANRSTR